MRLQDGDLPCLLEGLESLAGFVAEDRDLVSLLAASTVEQQPFQYGKQAGCSDGRDPRPTTLGRFAAEDDQPLLPVDVAEPERQHLTPSHAGVQRGDDHRP